MGTRVSPELAAKILELSGAPAAKPTKFVGLKRPRKYHNEPTTRDGVRFDSKREARRWTQLRLLLSAGLISDLRRQVRYDLVVNGVKVGAIVPDFVYTEAGLTVVEDVKSEPTMTPLFRWKAKHFAAQYGLTIKVV